MKIAGWILAWLACLFMPPRCCALAPTLNKFIFWDRVCTRMKRAVGAPRQRYQVFWAVIRFYTIDVMHKLIGRKFSAVRFFPDHNVLRHIAILTRVSLSGAGMFWRQNIHIPIPYYAMRFPRWMKSLMAASVNEKFTIARILGITGRAIFTDPYTAATRARLASWGNTVSATAVAQIAKVLIVAGPIARGLSGLPSALRLQLFSAPANTDCHKPPPTFSWA